MAVIKRGKPLAPSALVSELLVNKRSVASGSSVKTSSLETFAGRPPLAFTVLADCYVLNSCASADPRLLFTRFTVWMFSLLLQQRLPVDLYFFPPFFRFFNPPTDTLLLRNWKQYKLEGICTFLHCLACALFQTSYESGIFSRMFVFTTRDNEQAPKLGRRVFTTEVTGTLRQRRLKMIILPPLDRLNISTLFTSS